MTASRIGAIVAIFVVTTIGWAFLSTATRFRAESAYTRLGEGWEGSGRSSVQKLWGSPQVQPAPTVSTTHIEKLSTLDAKGKRVVQALKKEDPVVLTASRIRTDIELDPRRKGLMWYSTYKVKFAGEFAFTNEYPDKRTFQVRFRFPAGQAAYDNVVLSLNGRRVYPGGDLAEGVVASVDLAPKQAATLKVSYGSQGLDTWHYKFAENDAAASVRGFDATITTNTREIDFPASCLSPTHKTPTSRGWILAWKYGDLISSSNLGVSMPQKLQPGPFASRLSAFAPVSLFFFFAVLLIMSTVRDIRLHPMHFLLLAATFFSFHLLFSYLVDHVTPFNAFLISSAVSLLLTISYLRAVVNWKFAVGQAGLWQFVFLVLFTYAFFFEGYTGLTITIGAIVTLAVVMQVTARVNWDEVLSKQQQRAAP